MVKYDLESVKDSFDVTLVNDDGLEKAHMVILIALSLYFRNSESLKRIIIIGKSSINRVNYPNTFNQYTVIVTQGYDLRTQVSLSAGEHLVLPSQTETLLGCIVSEDLGWKHHLLVSD